MGYEYKVKIGNVEYTSYYLKNEVCKINRRLFSDFSIGNVSSAEIEIEIWPIEEPPVTAEIIPYVKGPETLGRWVQLGVFYTDERTRNSRTLVLHGYDAMYKADVDFKTYGGVASWPLPMSDVLSMIANTMGVRVDRRTVINPSYTMDYPEDYTCMDILKHIAAAHAGNFIITQMNELLLIPLTWNGNTISVKTNALSFEKYAKFNPVRKIILSVDDKMSYTAKSSEVVAGTPIYTMNAFCPSGTSQMAQNILTDLDGFEYQGFFVGMAAIPPTTQLWDAIMVRNYTGPETYEDYTGKVAEIGINFGPGFYSDVSAPGDSEAVHEYIGKTSAKDVNYKLEETASSLRTEFEENSMKIYRHNSNGAFTISNGQAEVEIINIDYKAKAGGDVVFQAEIKHVLTEIVSSENIDAEGTIENVEKDEESSDTSTFRAADLSVKYYINDVLLSYQPVHSEFIGSHILPLMYQWQNGETINNNFKATLQVSGGNISIASGDAIAYVIGQYGVEPSNKVISIFVADYPEKTEYYQGESLNYTGLRVHAFYEDGIESDITDQCSYSPQHGSEADGEGIISVTVTFKQEDETFTTNFILTLHDAIAVIDIYVAEYPTKMEYEQGEALDFTGLVVKAIMSDGTEKDITADCTFDPVEGTEV